MYVRVRCEAVQVLAPALLADYRSPFTAAAGADNPVVFAGFVVANSETGCGAAWDLKNTALDAFCLAAAL
jgi:hypothetical protein